jgi:small-conductance mechanosensitive channel
MTNFLESINSSTLWASVLEIIFFLLVLTAFFWIARRISGDVRRFLSKKHPVLKIFQPVIKNLLQIIVIFAVLNVLASIIELSNRQHQLLFDNSIRILMIILFGWLFIQTVNSLEKFIIYQYDSKDTAAIMHRKVKTQVTILKRIFLSIGIIVMVSSILLVFDNVRKLGAGLLTTAGIISAVGAFASQQSLSRIFAGLQIAFTQSVRIGDTVIVDGEFGEIEEVTLSNVVVKLWDLKRLILPTDYLTTRGFQNLTRTSTQLLGTIFLFVDYTIPIYAVREEFHKLVAQSKNWDQGVAVFHVTEMKEAVVELRGVVSAADVSKLWDLRCEIREKLLEFIVHHYSDRLPMTRSLTRPIK